MRAYDASLKLCVRSHDASLKIKGTGREFGVILMWVVRGVGETDHAVRGGAAGHERDVVQDEGRGRRP